jgi:adenine deaminase
MYSKACYSDRTALERALAIARGEKKASLVIKNARYLDVFSGSFLQGDIALSGATIVGCGESYEGERYLDAEGAFVVPGFIDAHVHIESSLMTPSYFAAAVLPLGTTTVLWDPHEIANVKGKAGIEWALAASEGLLLDIFVMLPSCVPATHPDLNLETGASFLQAEDLVPFRHHPRVLGLAEMMDYPAVVQGGADALAKLMSFQHVVRDGHCPGLRGKELNAYCASGVQTCHESSTYEEALEKLQKGLQVLIREGSCAKNADTLLPLVNPYTSAVLGLCSDDRNPADLESEGHINAIINRGLAQGLRPEDLFRVASYAVAKAYGLNDRGAVAPGYRADLCVVRPRKTGDWQQGFSVAEVIKAGQLVRDGQSKQPQKTGDTTTYFPPGSNVRIKESKPEDFVLAVAKPRQTREVDVLVMQVIKNQIITLLQRCTLSVLAGEIFLGASGELAKIAVIERHRGSGRSCTGLVAGFNLHAGAIATSIAHDCHNVVVVGADGAAMAAAVNYLREIDGGIVVWKNAEEKAHLALPLAGLMSDKDSAYIAKALNHLISLTKSMGCELEQPFLQLSFLALPVIGELKITDRGLVDVGQFKVVDLIAAER